jgi:hypothetical protein
MGPRARCRSSSARDADALAHLADADLVAGVAVAVALDGDLHRDLVVDVIGRVAAQVVVDPARAQQRPGQPELEGQLAVDDAHPLRALHEDAV